MNPIYQKKAKPAFFFILFPLFTFSFYFSYFVVIFFVSIILEKYI